MSLRQRLLHAQLERNRRLAKRDASTQTDEIKAEVIEATIGQGRVVGLGIGDASQFEVESPKAPPNSPVTNGSTSLHVATMKVEIGDKHIGGNLYLPVSKYLDYTLNFNNHLALEKAYNLAMKLACIEATVSLSRDPQQHIHARFFKGVPFIFSESHDLTHGVGFSPKFGRSRD